LPFYRKRKEEKNMKLDRFVSYTKRKLFIRLSFYTRFLPHDVTHYIAVSLSLPLKRRRRTPKPSLPPLFVPLASLPTPYPLSPSPPRYTPRTPRPWLHSRGHPPRPPRTSAPRSRSLTRLPASPCPRRPFGSLARHCPFQSRGITGPTQRDIGSIF
jgi:hypothetical protein